MKTIGRISIALAVTASLFAASCSKFEEKGDRLSSGKVFHASFEAVETPVTRTYLDSDHKLLWTADDRLSVFEGNTYNQQYRYTGQTGKTSADFEKVSSGLHSGNTISTIYAVYPYSPDTEISNAEKLTVTLPSDQQYAAGSFGLGANTMVAVTNGTSDNFLAFKNLCGYLVIKLYGEDAVKSISLKGNNGEKIAGTATVTASYGSDPSVAMANSATGEIIIDCGSGVVLGSTSSTATEFWFCIPPVTFSYGFSIRVINTSGWIMEKSISTSRTIARNTINTMFALAAKFTEPVVPIPEMVDLGLPSGVKWASFNLGASKPEEYGGYYQWAGLQDVTSTSICLFLENCPCHTGIFSDTGWTKYIPSSYSSYWSGAGSSDNKTMLELEDDVAHVTLGGNWRMPTNTEFEELINNCTWTWTQQNGINGYKVTSNISGYTDKWIFLPAAGYRFRDSLPGGGGFLGNYWSSSLTTGYPSSAFRMDFNPNGVLTSYDGRFYGHSVRPVYGSIVEVNSIDFDNNSISLKWGEQKQLTATISPSNATNKTIVWESDNDSVAAVDQNGVISASRDGNATITAYAGNGTVCASCTVSVSGIPEPEEFKAVDLGLSVKWASCNLGANKSDEYGGYYQWAGLEDVTSTSIYLDCDNCPYHTGVDSDTGWTKYVPSDKSSYWSGTGNPDNKMELDSEDDIAHVTLGGNWRMPTVDEWTELKENCTWIWTSLNGVNGYKVTGKKSGYTDKYIFLPAAGYRYNDNPYDAGSFGEYWSSSLVPFFPNIAGSFAFDSGSVVGGFGVGSGRDGGLSVRPVSE